MIYTCWGLIVLYHAVVIVIVPGSRVGISFLWRLCATGMSFNISGQVSCGFACKSNFTVPLVLVTLQGTNISHLPKRKIIFELAFSADTLVSGSVNRINIFVQNNPTPKNLLLTRCFCLLKPHEFCHQRPLPSFCCNICRNVWIFLEMYDKTYHQNINLQPWLHLSFQTCR